MPAISVLSWNAFGGNITALANAIASLNIDFTVIQEANNNAGHAWYNPLNALVGYTVVGGIRENVGRNTPGGNLMAPEPNLVRSYAYVYRNATIAAVNHTLVNYVTDGAYVVPNGAFNASQQGYNLRPPLRIDFTHNGNAVYFYTWHAPIGHTNTRGLTLVDGCQTLQTDVNTNDLVIIGADTNTVNINNYFNAFAGVQDHYDVVIAANTAGAGVVDTRTTGITLPQIGLLNALYVNPHWAVPAIVNY